MKQNSIPLVAYKGGLLTIKSYPLSFIQKRLYRYLQRKEEWISKKEILEEGFFLSTLENLINLGLVRRKGAVSLFKTIERTKINNYQDNFMKQGLKEIKKKGETMEEKVGRINIISYISKFGFKINPLGSFDKKDIRLDCKASHLQILHRWIDPDPKYFKNKYYEEISDIPYFNLEFGQSFTKGERENYQNINFIRKERKMTRTPLKEILKTLGNDFTTEDLTTLTIPKLTELHNSLAEKEEEKVKKFKNKVTAVAAVNGFLLKKSKNLMKKEVGEKDTVWCNLKEQRMKVKVCQEKHFRPTGRKCKTCNLYEQNKENLKMAGKTTTTAKKAPVKKAPVKKAVETKAPAKKAVETKAPAKKAVETKAPAKKAVETKTPKKLKVEILVEAFKKNKKVLTLDQVAKVLNTGIPKVYIYNLMRTDKKKSFEFEAKWDKKKEVYRFVSFKKL